MDMDIQAFKAAFRQRKRETSYQRANRVAEATRARKWAVYVEIPPKILWARFRAKDDDSGETLKRLVDDTERMAYEHATGRLWFEGELDYPVVLRDVVMLWHCERCDEKKPIAQFARIKAYPYWRHTCNGCAGEAVRVVWQDRRKAA